MSFDSTSCLLKIALSQKPLLATSSAGIGDLVSTWEVGIESKKINANNSFEDKKYGKRGIVPEDSNAFNSDLLVDDNSVRTIGNKLGQVEALA